MTVLYIILGAAAGGTLGWLFDHAVRRQQPRPDEECGTTA